MTVSQSLALAVEHFQAGRLGEVERICRAVLAAEPGNSEAIFLLGVLANQTGHAAAAVELLGQAARLSPSDARIHNALGVALKDQGRPAEALAALDRAIALRPDDAGMHSNRGNALAALRRHGEAEGALRRAVALNPNFPAAHANLGNVLREMDRMDEAIVELERAAALEPGNGRMRSNLANALRAQGRVDEAREAFARAVQLAPDDPEVWDNQLYAMHDDPRNDPAAFFAAHTAWGRKFGGETPAARDRDRSVDRVLRIGYVSPDFREHSVVYFFENVLLLHDPGKVEVFCYADLAVADAVTRRLMERGTWRNVTGENHAAVAQRIAEDRIDILVDLAGHTAGNRLPVFARKPAAVQVTYLGYPDTTGLRAMDYRLTDAFADPPGTGEAFHVERLVRLPRTFLCYRPPGDAPPVAGRADGPVTFGSFNQMHKINDAVLDAWARILKNTGDSRLILKTAGLADAGTRDRVRKRFEAAGVAGDRVELRPRLGSRSEHLGLYGRVDIALDTFPYNGTATTCEALWMGVAVVTSAGDHHAGRVGVSILSNVGTPELIGSDTEDYVRIAMELAEDAGRLAEYRAGMRERMRRSPVMDGERFVANLETAYHDMWRRA